MNKLFLCALVLSVSNFAWSNSKAQLKDATSWSLLYGRASLKDGTKHAEDLSPTGNSFKGIWGHRSNYFEVGFMVRYAKLTEDLKFETVPGEFSHKDLTLGIQGGFWAFSWLQLHLGYAYHGITEKVTGEFTEQQDEDLSELYGLVDSTVFGVYGGADLVLLRNERFQFFVNYDYYYLNSLNAHDWEAMVGLRIYLKPSNVGKGNFFVKLFTDLLGPKKD